MSKTSDIANRVGWDRIDRMGARMQGWRIAMWQWRRNEIRGRIERHPVVPGSTMRFRNQKEAETFVFERAKEGDRLCLRAVGIITKLRLGAL